MVRYIEIYKIRGSKIFLLLPSFLFEIVVRHRALLERIRYQEENHPVVSPVVTNGYFVRNHSCSLSDHCDVFWSYLALEFRELLP